MLSQFFDIEIVPQRKVSSVTLPFFRIDKLITDKDVIDITTFLKKRIDERMADDTKNGTNQKTAFRRGENYKVIECLHYLADILSLFGYDYLTHLSTGKKGTLKAETIYTIYSDDYVLKQNTIIALGSAVNKYVSSLRFANGKVIIKKGDLAIQQLVSGSMM